MAKAELPYTLSRAPLRRRAPFAWLASLRSLVSYYQQSHFFDRLALGAWLAFEKRNSRVAANAAPHSARRRRPSTALCAEHRVGLFADRTRTRASQMAGQSASLSSLARYIKAEPLLPRS